MKVLAQRIKQAREAAGLKQKELAAAMRLLADKFDPKLDRIDDTYISAWENGRLSTLRVYDLAAISEITGFPMDWFVGLLQHIGDERPGAGE